MFELANFGEEIMGDELLAAAVVVAAQGGGVDGLSRTAQRMLAAAYLAERVWQPIETAPKSGRFLVATDDGRAGVVEPHVCNGWAYEPPGEIMGPIRPGATPSSSGPMPYKITHWMPLPEPPILAELTEKTT